MPKTKKYDPSIGEERTVYYRSIPEAYGPIYLWLEPLKAGNDTIRVNDQDIWLPTIEVEKYYPGAKCYALIEKLDNFPVAMVDILYAYKDISPLLDNDKFLEHFLRSFSRTRINALNLRSPALVVSPTNKEEMLEFEKARQQALKERMGTEIICLDYMVQQDIEVDNKEQSNAQVKQDNIIIDFIKCFYEAISRKPIERPSAKKTKTVEASLLRQLRMMKSGATVISGKAIGKYFTSYYLERKIGDDVKEIGDMFGIHFESLDDYMLTSPEETDIERKNRFRDTLFDSYLLETFMDVYKDKKPIMLFAGQYNEPAGKMQVDKRVANYFNEINEMLVPTRPSADGR